MRVIYADTLFALNFAVNYLMLLATAKISAAHAKRLKIVFAAALGGAYAVASVLVAQTLMQNLVFKIGAAVLMLLVCFGRERGLLRISLIFFAVSAAFGGIVLAVSLIGGGSATEALIPVSLEILIPSFGVSYAVIALVFKRLGRRRSGGLADIVIKSRGKKVEIKSLIDTGNSLIDPISGKGVIVAEIDALSPLFEPEVVKILHTHSENAIQTLENLSGEKTAFRLIPYSAVGVERGMLLAYKPDEILINGRDKTGMLVAVSPTRLSEGGIYSAIVGGEAEVGA